MPIGVLLLLGICLFYIKWAVNQKFRKIRLGRINLKGNMMTLWGFEVETGTREANMSTGYCSIPLYTIGNCIVVTYTGASIHLN